MGANTSWQYEAPKMPSGWSNDDEKRRFYNRLIEVLDEIYLKYGRIDEKMLSVTVRKTLEEAGGIVTEVVDARGDKSTLAQRINEIVSRVEDVAGDFSEISQTVDTITITVGRVEKKADDAQTAADGAQASADNAQTAANGAQASADNAQNTATAARTATEQLQVSVEGVLEQTVDGVRIGSRINGQTAPNSLFAGPDGIDVCVENRAVSSFRSDYIKLLGMQIRVPEGIGGLIISSFTEG